MGEGWGEGPLLRRPGTGKKSGYDKERFKNTTFRFRGYLIFNYKIINIILHICNK